MELVSLDLAAKSSAVIFGHSDADGHLAAEQSRRNLVAQKISVEQVVVSHETRSYRFWEQFFPKYHFAQNTLVLCVDISLNFRRPQTSIDAINTKAKQHPESQFVIIDHHSIGGITKVRPNVMLVEAPTVYDCCLGEPTDELMVVAAICDGDAKVVRSRTTDTLQKRAVGVRRAAADTRGLSGSTLMALLGGGHWDFIEALAEEPKELHHTARGRRTLKGPMSPMLKAAAAFVA